MPSLEETLAEALRPVIADEMTKALAALDGASEKLLDAAGAAELLSMSEEAIRTLAKRRQIPRVVLPTGRVRFEVDALLAWARSGGA